MSVAPDIYNVINEWFIGEYVLADIGTKFFMNWAVRIGLTRGVYYGNIVDYYLFEMLGKAKAYIATT